MFRDSEAYSEGFFAESPDSPTVDAEPLPCRPSQRGSEGRGDQWKRCVMDGFHDFFGLCASRAMFRELRRLFHVSPRKQFCGRFPEPSSAADITSALLTQAPQR
tara:strand:- start:2152 stop:2463 length:312 start_codon:yes stop_codon:yes gene_type:complete